MEKLINNSAQPTSEEMHLLDLATAKAQLDLDAMVATCHQVNKRVNDILSRDLSPFKHACECLVRLMNLAQDTFMQNGHQNPAWTEALEKDHEGLLRELKDLNPEKPCAVRMVNLTYGAWLDAVLQGLEPPSAVQAKMALRFPGLSRVAKSPH